MTDTEHTSGSNEERASIKTLAKVAERSIIACLHEQNKSGFFGRPAFFQPNKAT